MQNCIKKHIFIFLGIFLFVYFGVNRFMRGQIGLGTLKLIIDWVGIQAVVDFIIALIKYNNYKEDFVFIYGKWT